jgi:putative photosynthetic complex assembly protein
MSYMMLWPNLRSWRFNPVQPALRSGGFVEVFDWDSGATISRVGPGEGSFLRGVVRSLVRQRAGLESATAPFQLTLLEDQRLILSDPETGEDINLNAFGPTNLAVFSAFIVAPNRAPMTPR